MTTTTHIQPSKKRQFQSVTKLLRKYSVIVAHYANQLHIRALHVLFFRTFVIAFLSLFCFYSDSYGINLLWLLLIAIAYFLDFVDGDIARNHNQVTEVGGFLDGNLDVLILNIIIFVFTLRFLEDGEPHVFVIWGIFALFGTILSAKMTTLFEYKFSIGCGQGSDIIEKHIQTNKLDRMSQLFYELITPKRFIFSLLSNFREYLLIGIIFGIMPYTLFLFSIAINIRWIVLFTMVAVYYNTKNDNTKIQLFELMKQSEK